MGITAAGSGSIEKIVPAPRSPGSAAIARPLAWRRTLGVDVVAPAGWSSRHRHRFAWQVEGGGVLRRLSPDVLPQLINMLFGRMSLVGPRPSGDDRSPAGQRTFGLSWEESVRLDLCHVENWSPVLGAMVLWKTIGAVSGGRGPIDGGCGP